METQIQRITLDVPYQNTIYGAKKDAEISYMCAQVIHQDLKEVATYLEDKGPPAESSPEDIQILIQPFEMKEELEFMNIT